MFKDNDVCVLSYSRTPIGSFNGKLKKFTAVQLGSIVISSALSKGQILPSEVEDVYIGNVLSANLGQAPARQAALGANISKSTPCTTINKVCSSGLKSVAIGAAEIKLGRRDVVVVGGMESMSNVPFYSTTTRFGNKFGNTVLIDGLAQDGLEDAFSRNKMGDCAELCASTHNYTRKMQDDYSAQSYLKAVKATKQGKFKNEIVAIELDGGYGKPSAFMSEDEECTTRPVTSASLASMRTAGFTPPKGKIATVTAGSSSTISDGAAAIVLCSGRYAKKKNRNVLAIITGWDDAAKNPEWFTTSPSDAITKALSRSGHSISDVDAFEINEAFSVVALVNRDLLDIDPSKLNVYGGAVSLGHPLGCSGTRILCTLLTVLLNEGGKIGCAAICNGGGGSTALVCEIPQNIPQNIQKINGYSKL